MSRARDLADAGSKANYLDNVSADINTTYAPKASPTFTGTSTFADLKATAIKHTNGTTAITINSDGSLSGKFEGAMKFVSIGKATGNPTDTNKVWIVFGITSSYSSSSISGKQLATGFGQPVGILNYNTGTSSWNSWHYVNQTTTNGAGGQLSDSSSTPTGDFYQQQGFTYTIEMDKV